MIGIYKITNPKNKVYVGQSINIERRFIDYKKSLKKAQIKIYNSIKKYGYENHVFEIIEECEPNKLNERENFWIKYYNSITPHGYNIVENNSNNGYTSYRFFDKNKVQLNYGKYRKKH